MEMVQIWLNNWNLKEKFNLVFVLMKPLDLTAQKVTGVDLETLS